MPIIYNYGIPAMPMAMPMAMVFNLELERLTG